jgi:hypothetical protein
MGQYQETRYDKIDRILFDWIIPLGGIALIVVCIIWVANNCS